MRIILSYLALFVILATGIVVLNSCNKKDEPPAPHQDSFEAKVNGVSFVPKEISMGIYPYGSSPAFFLWSRDANGRVVQVILKNYASSSKSAIIDTVSLAGAVADFEEGVGAFYMRRGLSGSLNINSVDKTTYSDGEVVSGTFEFITENGYVTPIPYVITEGKFSVFLKK